MPPWEKFLNGFSETHSGTCSARWEDCSPEPPTQELHVYKYIKHFQKMYRDVGMAMPKTTETRCRDGSVQGRHVIQRLHN